MDNEKSQGRLSFSSEVAAVIVMLGRTVLAHREMTNDEWLVYITARQQLEKR